MTNPFLYKHRGMILPDKIEVGKKIINHSGFIEEIYKVNKFKDITRFCTLEEVHDNVEIHRFYDMRKNKITKINQRVYDREFRIGFGGSSTIPLL